MEERVNTGGLHTFVHTKGNEPKLSVEEELEIDEAYAKHYKRKKRNKIITISVIAVIILVIIYFVFL